MTIKTGWMVVAALAGLGACGGGVIEIEATLPLPADGTTGVIVTVPDGSSVCDRTQILVFAQAPKGDVRAVPTGVTPLVAAGGFGRYSAASPRCTMVAHVAPGDYWVIVALPTSSYSTGGAPTLPGAGGRATGFRAGAYPVHVDKDKGTKLALTLTSYP